MVSEGILALFYGIILFVRFLSGAAPASVDWQVDLTSAPIASLVAQSRRDCDPSLDFKTDEVNSFGSVLMLRGQHIYFTPQHCSCRTGCAFYHIMLLSYWSLNLYSQVQTSTTSRENIKQCNWVRFSWKLFWQKVYHNQKWWTWYRPSGWNAL